MIKFHKHYVTNGTDKARVRYSPNVSANNGQRMITLYAKDYERNLGKIFTNIENETDLMTDYFDEDKVRIYDTDPQYTPLLDKLREWKMVSI